MRPTLAEIRRARALLREVARVTPVHGSETLSRLTGRSVTLKAEALQRTGSFKVRGAVVKLASRGGGARRGGGGAGGGGRGAGPPHGRASSRQARAITARRWPGRPASSA